ncbi:MAG: hypothetical protein CMM93_07275 [Rickettsiales bacterium]|nr:hypothetical protein [Rickettsiales bacterium]|tara:strand:+ start:815 stop:1405 length:591 start_codon:yes stop_codon:yes gene_type:complete
MSHARTQIRQAVVALLKNNTGAGSRVYEARVYALQEPKLPALLVYTKQEVVGDQSMSRPRTQQRELMLSVEAYVKAVGFRFKDWSDYKGENQPLTSLGGNDYQMVKQYSSGAVAVEREITKPVAGTIKLYEDSVLQVSGWSVDTATGIITTALSGTLTVDFEFDVPVRFDTDEMSISMDSFDAGNWNSIPLIEVRV